MATCIFNVLTRTAEDEASRSLRAALEILATLLRSVANATATFEDLMQIIPPLGPSRPRAHPAAAGKRSPPRRRTRFPDNSGRFLFTLDECMGASAESALGLALSRHLRDACIMWMVCEVYFHGLHLHSDRVPFSFASGQDVDRAPLPALAYHAIDAALPGGVDKGGPRADSFSDSDDLSIGVNDDDADAIEMFA